MVVGIKDAAKLIGISIISCCAVFVCTLFLNFYLDVTSLKDSIAPGPGMFFYEAQVMTAKVVCLVTGGCLLITSVIMLLFYIKHYIDTHKKELGILKALGYSNLSIARHFWVFGICVLTGCALGFGGSFLLMPKFYELQNAEKRLPDFSIQFHPQLLVYLVVLPTAAFALLAIAYAFFKMRQPVLKLLRDSLSDASKTKKQKEGKNTNLTFLEHLRRSTIKSKKVLAFFIVFASFCYSAMTQMSFSMKDLSSEMMGAMMLIIGLVLAFTTLFLAITTVVNGNRKTIAMMRVFGYTQTDCRRSLLDGYRPLAYIGFAVGTGYQYGLLRLMVDIVFKDIEGVPAYEFDVPMMLVSLASFAVLYEVIMHVYAMRIGKISIKEIMLEG